MQVYDALRESRALSGKSQEYIAMEMGVARKTVQNWENGISEPSIGQAFQWFNLLGISPLPYFYQLLHANMEGISGKDELPRLQKAMYQVLDTLPEESIRQLLYLFYGTHGSSPRAILNMLTAHLQSPMEERVTNGTIILKGYEMAKRKERLTDTDHVQPDVELLRRAIDKGEDAAVENKGAYVLKE